jgi:Arc/MetJ-type ribon-helix-helix transcriptional regulator
MTTKIAVSLPDELVEGARRAVADGRSASVSAYVAEAMAERARRQSLADVLAEWREELGPPSAEDEAWARSALGLDDDPA